MTEEQHGESQARALETRGFNLKLSGLEKCLNIFLKNKMLVVDGVNWSAHVHCSLGKLKINKGHIKWGTSVEILLVQNCDMIFFLI